MRRIVKITDIPHSPENLDVVITITVALPPGSGNGPQVSDNPRQWGKSAAGYRASIDLSYQWFESGRTHLPVGKGRNRHWIRSRDPSRYPPLTEAGLIALCFPTSSQKARRNLLLGARRVIARLAMAGELETHEMPNR